MVRLALLALACLSRSATADDCLSGSTAGYVYPRGGSGESGGIFHWLFPSQSASPHSDPTVIWLQGGPGASSLLGAFYEQGPCLVSDEGTLETLKPNPWSWNKAANLMYIDQPMGTGFSFLPVNGSGGSTGWVEDMDTMAKDMLQTILLLLEKYPYMKTNPLILSGESYAGRYVPYLATYVDRHNKAIIANKDATTTTTTSTTTTTATTIPLTTLFLNDPWTNPAKIVSTYAEFSLAHGIITPADVDALGRNLTLFNAAMTAGRFDDATDIEHGMEHYIEAAGGGLNAYDIRRYAGYTYDALGKLLSSPSLKARLNVGNHSWQLSSDAVNSHLHADISRATDDLVGALLSSPAPNNYHVVIYNGNYDLDCNIAGTLKWLKDVRWPGAQAFANATVTAGSRRTWRLPPVKLGRNKAGDRNDNASAAAAAAVAGYCVEVDNLSQVVVLNAGHMVPLNQPRAAFMLLTNALKALNKPEGRVCTD